MGDFDVVLDGDRYAMQSAQWVACLERTVGGIGCRQGMEVGGDVESLGRRVTSAVVQAIFAIILIDAAFALLYMEMDI